MQTAAPAASQPAAKAPPPTNAAAATDGDVVMAAAGAAAAGAVPNGAPVTPAPTVKVDIAATPATPATPATAGTPRSAAVPPSVAATVDSDATSVDTERAVKRQRTMAPSTAPAGAATDKPLGGVRIRSRPPKTDHNNSHCSFCRVRAPACARARAETQLTLFHDGCVPVCHPLLHMSRRRASSCCVTGVRGRSTWSGTCIVL